METMRWASVEDLMNDLKGRCDYAILCGSGISRDAGLQTGQNFQALVRQFAPDFKGELLLAELLTRSLEMLPPLRFEGILEVLQRTVDHELDTLNPYRKGNQICIHRALAKVLDRQPVLTTNFDVLVERAAVATRSPCRVCFKDDDFLSHSQLEGDLNGLWKLHGTLSSWIDGKEHPLEATDIGFPIATLKSLSASRESVSRKALLARVLRQHDVVILGYSGSDDFDVSRWLVRREFDDISEAPTKPLIWLQHTSQTGDPRLIGGNKILTDTPEGLDSGLVKLIFHWNQKGWLGQLYVILHNQPAHFLTAVVNEPCTDADHRNHQEGPPIWDPFKSVASRTEWIKQLVTGSLLSSMALYQEALPYLSQAVAASNSGRERSVSLLALAAAKLEVGNRELRNHAVEHARVAQCELKGLRPELQSLYYRAQFLEATAARLTGSQDQEQHIGTLLKCFQACRDKEGQDASLSELAADILVELRRSRRHIRRGSTAPADGDEPFTQEEYLDYITKNGLITAKGLDIHERARGNWEAAGSRDDLHQILSDMQSAAELRRDLGDIRGLCESLVLCGHLYLRQCDWPGKHPNPTEIVVLRNRAKAAYLESYDLARRHGLLWDTVQAAISVAIAYAWSEQNYAAAFQFLQEAGQNPWLVNDAVDNLRIDFVRAVLPLLTSPEILDFALLEAMQKFSILGTHHRQAKGRVADRMRTAARINAFACHFCVAADAPAASEMRQKLVSLAEVGLSKRETSTINYWVDRVRELANVLERCEWRDSGQRLVAALIDPLPP